MIRFSLKNAGWAVCFVAGCFANPAARAVTQDISVAGDSLEVARHVEEAHAAVARGDGRRMLEKLWSLWEVGGGSAHQRRELARLLAEAWMESGQGGDAEKAVWVLGEITGEDGTEAPALELTRGRALFRAGRVDEASTAVDRAERAGADPGACALLRAACLLEFGRLENARDVLYKAVAARDGLKSAHAETAFALDAALTGVLIDLENWGEANRCLERMEAQNDMQRAVLDLLQARLWCLEGRVAEAISHLERVMSLQPLASVEVRWAALLALVRATATHAGKAEACRVVGRALDMEWGHERAALLVRLWLDLPGSVDSASEAAWKSLKQSASPLTAGWAAFCLGQIAWNVGKKAFAAEEWEALVRSNNRHPAAARVWVQRAEAALAEFKWDAAAEMLVQAAASNTDPVFGGYVYLRLGAARFGAGDFGGALNAFETAWRSGARWAREASFNGGIAAVRAGAVRKAVVWLERLRRVEADHGGDAERLELEVALALAREGASNAGESLQVVLGKRVDATERSILMLALAEWSVQRALRFSHEGGDAQQIAEGRESAQRHLDLLAQAAFAAADSTDFLRFVLETLNPSAESGRIMALGDAFFQQHAQSPLCADVSFSLGEYGYRAGHFADAERWFLSAAERAQEPGLRECALYLAGQSAARAQDEEAPGRALVHWDAVAQIGGKLRWKARYQQASLKCHMSSEREGILLYELILKAAPEVDASLVFAARCGRADGLLSLARRSRTRPDDALEEYRTLAEAAKAAPVWRTQALYKVAKAQEESAPEEALSLLMEILANAGSEGEEDAFWVFRAGFDAARILEERRQWREAVGIYERLALRKGTRSKEAASRAHQLRLEHFLWKQ